MVIALRQLSGNIYSFMISFKPKQITKSLLGVLPERARDVLTKRYGLGPTGETSTLESIGQAYGITRERVRQIENYGIQSIQKSEEYKKIKDARIAKIKEEQAIIDKEAKEEQTKLDNDLKE